MASTTLIKLDNCMLISSKGIPIYYDILAKDGEDPEEAAFPWLHDYQRWQLESKYCYQPLLIIDGIIF